MAALSTLIFSSDAMAQINPKFFKDITRHFKEEKKAYSPVLGEIALENGLIHNLRFYGNYKSQTDEENRRDYIKDAAQDSLSSLVKSLFPSPVGNIAPETGAKDNFGKYVNDPKTIAFLLNFSNQYRLHLKKLANISERENHRDYLQKIKTIMSEVENIKQEKKKNETAKKKLDKEKISQDEKKIRLNKLNSEKSEIDEKSKKQDIILKTIREDLDKEKKALNISFNQYREELLEKINQSLTEKDVTLNVNMVLEQIESSICLEKDSIYPQYTTEQVISAFFCLKFDTRKHILELLEILDPEIIDKTQPLPQLEDYWSKTDLLPIAQKQDSFDLDDMYALANASFFNLITPYKPGTSLLSNGLTNAYDRKSNSIFNGQFQDCVEVSARHIMNFLLYNAEEKIFDLQHIADQALHNPYFDNFRQFYKIQEPDMANAGNKEVRNQWNRVMGDLNALDTQINSVKKINYKQGTYELNSGLVNFVAIFEKIFGLSLGTFPIHETFENKKKWLEQSLQTLFKTVNPNRTYNMDLTRLFEKNSEISGTLPIIFKNKEDTIDLFSFNFYTEHDKHANVDSLKLLLSNVDRNYISDLESHKNNLHSDTAEDSVWLIIDAAKEINHPFYSLFKRAITNDDSRIEALRSFNNLSQKKLISKSNNNKEWFSKEFQGNFLKNIMLGISWDNSEVIKKISPLIFHLYTEGGLQEELKIALLEHVRKIRLFHKQNHLLTNGEFSFPSMPNLTHLDLNNFGIKKIKGLEKLKKLKYLDLSITSSLEEISFPEMTDLENLNLNGSHIKKIEGLEKLSRIQVLNLSNTPNLEELELGDISKLVRSLNLYKSRIKKLTMERHSALEEFDLRETTNLEKINLQNVPNIRKIFLNNSNIKQIEGLEIANNLTELDLSDTSNLEELSFPKMPALQNLFLAGSNVRKIEGLEKLSELHTLGLSNTKNLEKLEVRNVTDLKKITLIDSGVKEISIDNLSNLSDLDLSDTSNLEELKIQNMLSLASFELPKLGVKKVFLKNLPKVQKLTWSKNSDTIQDIQLEDMPNLKEFLLIGPEVKKLTLDNLSHLEELDLTAVENLTDLTIRNMQNLTEISLDNDGSSKINNIYLENIDNLEVLNFSSLTQLESVTFKGSFAKLKEISVDKSSSLKAIEGLDELIALKKLNVQGTSFKSYLGSQEDVSQ